MLELAGYDRSFEMAAARPLLVVDRPSGDILLKEGRILLPAGVRLDLGGIAKGMAVDCAAQLIDRGLINAGGDLYAKGGTYIVGVEDPFHPERDLVTLRVADRGVATSSTWKRRWSAAAHHLIDPRTSSPSNTDVMSATVIARRAEEAEIAAKVALLQGLRTGHIWLQERRLPGLLIGRDGTLLASAGFEDYLAVR